LTRISIPSLTLGALILLVFGSDLTDDCVDYSLTFDTLIDVGIADSQITEIGLKRLRDGLKQCKVSTSSHRAVYLDRNKK
jgi:hypothetical protein